MRDCSVTQVRRSREPILLVNSKQRVVYTALFQSQGNRGARRRAIRESPITRRLRDTGSKEEGTARARARAARRGYNPRTRRILHVRKCRQPLGLRGRDCSGKRRKTLESARSTKTEGGEGEVFNVAGAKGRAYSGMNDLTVAASLKHAFARSTTPGGKYSRDVKRG